MHDGSITTSPAAAADGARRRDPFRWVLKNPGTVDLIVFAAAAVLMSFFALLSGSAGWWLLVSVPMVLAGALCRTRPLLGVVVIGALAVAHLVVGIPVVAGDVMTFYAMYCAVAHGTPAVHRIGVGAGMLGVFAQALTWSTIALNDGFGGLLEGLAVFMVLTVVGTITIVAIWAVANLQRARLRQLALTRERAEQAVREREQRTALAVADERARIAREMHDVVAHSLSVIIAQADGGRFIASQKPERAAEVLGTIGETGRAALADMRALLGVLRQEEETGYGPQPGPEQLPDLATRVRAAGTPVELKIDGDLTGLPQALGMSVFRLVQEALTNVLKHGGQDAAASVRLTRTDSLLEIEVLDDGQGVDSSADGLGHGLTGMRERMTLFRGTLQAGPLPTRGFRVLARVPLPVASADARPTTPPSPSAPGPASAVEPPSAAGFPPAAPTVPHPGETR